MSKRLLYTYGEPGTGKITVARILRKRLGWRLFWLHDLDAVCAIVERYPLPRLMDRISLAVLEELMDDEQDIIYVRPSRDLDTVTKVLGLAESKGYAVYLFQLWATHETLVERVTARVKSEFRVSSRADLNVYLSARPPTSEWRRCDGFICTEDRTAEEVADEIQRLMEAKDEQRSGQRGIAAKPASQTDGCAGQRAEV